MTNLKGLFDTSFTKLCNLEACEEGLERFALNELREDGTISLAEIVKQQNNSVGDVIWYAAEIWYAESENALTEEQLNAALRLFVDWLGQDDNERHLNENDGTHARYNAAKYYIKTGDMYSYSLQNCCYYILDDIITSYYNEEAPEIIELLEQL